MIDLAISILASSVAHGLIFKDVSPVTSDLPMPDGVSHQNAIGSFGNHPFSGRF